MLPAQVAMPVSMSKGQRAVRQLVWGITPAIAACISECHHPLDVPVICDT